MREPNKAGAGKGEIPFTSHTGRALTALPEQGR
jgi:hypothetical protein